MDYKSFYSKRLYIRPTSEEDAQFIFKLLNSPKWLKFIGDRNIKTLESARDYINSKMIPQLERLGFSNYTVIRKTDGTKLGTCGLYDREGTDGIDIGFAFLPEFEGKGYAYEASSQIKFAAFNEFGIESLSAFTAKTNMSSQRLLQKLGFKLVGTTKLPNDNEELFYFKM